MKYKGIALSVSIFGLTLGLVLSSSVKVQAASEWYAKATFLSHAQFEADASINMLANAMPDFDSAARFNDFSNFARACDEGKVSIRALRDLSELLRSPEGKKWIPNRKKVLVKIGHLGADSTKLELLCAGGPIQAPKVYEVSKRLYTGIDAISDWAESLDGNMD
jgi:hypothetical protein